MATLKNKLTEAKTRLKEIMLRKGPAANAHGAGTAPTLSPGERKIRRAMGRFERLQSQVERLEARVRSYEVGGESGNAWAPEDTPTDPAIEAELEQLKKRIAPKAASKTNGEAAIQSSTE